MAEPAKKPDEKKPEITLEQKEITQLQNQVSLLTQSIQQEKELKEREGIAAKEVADEEAAAAILEAADLKKLLGETDKDKLEDLSNREMLNVIGDAFESAQKAKDVQLAKLISDGVNTTSEDIKGIKQAVMQIIAVQGVKEAQDKFPDFEDYREDAANIMKTSPGLSVERAILLAKAERAGHNVPAKKVESERPGSHVTLPGRDGLDEVISRRTNRDSSQEEGGVTTGIVGFRALLSAGVDKAIVRKE